MRDFEQQMLGIKARYWHGLYLVASPHFQTAIHTRRTWKERLFTLPWTPLQATKITGYKPLDFAVRVGNVIYAAPEVIEKMKATTPILPEQLL